MAYGSYNKSRQQDDPTQDDWTTLLSDRTDDGSGGGGSGGGGGGNTTTDYPQTGSTEIGNGTTHSWGTEPAGQVPGNPPQTTGSGSGSGSSGDTGGLTYNGGNDPVGWIRQVSGSMSPTTQNLNYIYNALKAAGVNVYQPTHAGGQVSEDKLVINGQMYDFLVDVNNGVGSSWSYSPSSDSGDGGGGTDYSSLYGLIDEIMKRYGFSSTSTGTTQTDAQRQQIEDAYTKLITENSADVGDVSTTPQATAYANASQRAAEYNRAQLAERAGASGMGQEQGGATTGGFDSDVMGLQQAQGEANAKYQAELAQQILSDRQTRLQTALTQYGGYLNEQDRITLQSQLQSVTAALDMARLAVQNTQYYDNLGYLIGRDEQSANERAATV